MLVESVYCSVPVFFHNLAIDPDTSLKSVFLVFFQHPKIKGVRMETATLKLHRVVIDTYKAAHFNRLHMQHLNTHLLY